ncbi:MAG: FecR family protein [Opitutaceae bacterium]
MKISRFPLLLITFYALSSLALSAVQLSTVKALSVTGTVTKQVSSGQNSPLVAGDILKVGDSVSATALSSAHLVFSNGSTLDVQENTSFTITEFEQDPFSSGGKEYEELEADPSKSQILLNLHQGELDGHAKKLYRGSALDVETPIGTAAIRGTKYSVKLRHNMERGVFLLVIKNKDGTVNVVSRYSGQFEYDEKATADKNYNSALSSDTKEPIPAKHTVIIRLHHTDPYYDELFTRFPANQLIRIFTPDDPGTQVVSPNTEQQQQQN